jgi:prepilin-type N-terminal cleavage/methylation domain-containing protein
MDSNMFAMDSMQQQFSGDSQQCGDVQRIAERSRCFMTSNQHQHRAFTIVELLVVVSIIALLIGILLPAIGKARDQALVSQSQSQLRQIGTAHASYAGEWNDKQFSHIPDNLSYYGNSWTEALQNYEATNGTELPWAVLGYNDNFIWGLAFNAGAYLPLDFWASGGSWFGSFRIVNTRGFSKFLNNRFYDPVFFAPKDKIVQEVISDAQNDPAEYVPSGEMPGGRIAWSSYCSSPAALMSPDVLGNANGTYWRNPWNMNGGWRTPSYGQALYPTLKTHVLEHHWLQNMNKECSPFFAGGTYNGCEPFFFNHSIVSSPVTLFYDGHIELVGTMTADNAHKRVLAQSGHGLWSRNTPMGGNYTPDFAGSSGGYYSGMAEDWTNTSFHILTIEGIRGRDIVSD